MYNRAKVYRGNLDNRLKLYGFVLCKIVKVVDWLFMLYVCLCILIRLMNIVIELLVGNEGECSEIVNLKSSCSHLVLL